MGNMTDRPEPGLATRRYPAQRFATQGIGNPHLVLLVDDADKVDLGVDGPLLEADYKEGMNVHFVDVASKDEIRLRVWERGAGVTEACGSGATVAAAVAHGWGLVGDQVRVSMPGGVATVDISDRGLMLTGPAVFVGRGAYHGPGRYEPRRRRADGRCWRGLLRGAGCWRTAGPRGAAQTQESHRGGFGDFGGESGSFIERTFRERIIVVGVSFPPHDDQALDESLDELALLVDTAGADVVGRIVQRRDHPDPATYVGKGKVEEILSLPRRRTATRSSSMTN